MTQTSLTELLAGVADQDRAAFDALYRELETPLYRFIRSRLNDPFESADVLHDVFLEIWRGASRFEGRSSVKTWAFGIAYRKVIDVFRRSSRLEVTDDLPDVADGNPGGEACLLSSERNSHLAFCLDTLSADHRVAINLAFFEDMGYREISEVTDVPEGTIKTRVFHAKKLLLHCLEGRLTSGDVA